MSGIIRGPSLGYWDCSSELPEFHRHQSTGKRPRPGVRTGTNATPSKHGWQVIGVDFARRAISTAKQKSPPGGVDVDLRVGDVPT